MCVCVAAGTVMFEYGMRLGREVRTLRGLQKQVNCYLSALNCLRLIRPEYAWIIQPSSGAAVSLHLSLTCIQTINESLRITLLII